jgi:hypothetical protein
MRQRRFRATKTTGTRSSPRAFRSSNRFASAGVIPPTSTPSMLTPPAIRFGDPA